MKRIIIIAIILLVCIGIGIFFFKEKHISGVAKLDKHKVLFLMNGSADDLSWCASHKLSMEKVAKSLDLEVIYKENMSSDEQILQAIDEAVTQNDTNIVIGNSWGFGNALAKAADKYHDVFFIHVSGVNKKKNLTSFFGRMYQARYLSGVVAGLQSKSNKIGYIASFPISEVNRGINAFTLGARSVNKNVQVYVKWTGSWESSEIAEEKTRELLDQYPSIDVLAMHVDTNKVLDIAEEKGIWSIGYNYDNLDKYKKTFLTAPVWHWENFYEPLILEVMLHKATGDVYWQGIETGLVGLGRISNKASKISEKTVNELTERMNNSVFDVFYGPINDNNGQLRVLKDENLSDEQLLQQIDWYVEGVVLE